MIGLRKSGVTVAQGGVFLRKGGVLVEQEVYLRKGGALQLIHAPGSPIELEVPADAYGAAASNANVAVTTSVVAVVVTGGTPPYSYQWQRTDAALGPWSILSPTFAGTAFRRASLAPAESDTAAFSVTVTDARGNSVTSGDIIATVLNYGGLGGPGGLIP